METQKTQHTPGPWHIQNAVGAWSVCCGTQQVAKMVRFPNEDEFANARLIAAAPELLEACKTALANLAPKYCNDHSVMQRLRDSIANAEGNQ